MNGLQAMQPTVGGRSVFSFLFLAHPALPAFPTTVPQTKERDKTLLPSVLQMVSADGHHQATRLLLWDSGSAGMGDVRVRQGWFLQNEMVHSGFPHILCLDPWFFQILHESSASAPWRKLGDLSLEECEVCLSRVGP